MIFFVNHSGKVRSGWLFLSASFLVFVFQFLLVTPFSLYLGGKKEDLSVIGLMDTHPFISAWFGMSIEVAMVLAVMIMWVYVQNSRMSAIGLAGNGTGWKNFGFGLMLGALSMFLIFMILWGTGSIRVGNNWYEPDFSWNNILYLVTFVTVGFSEEFFFRGYVIRTMEQREAPPWLIYGVSSLLFTAAHMGNMGISSLAIINLILVSLLFAFMFRMTRSLWMPIGFHISWNYFQGIVFGFPVSGNPVDSIYHSQMVFGHDLMSGGGFGPEGGVLTTILIGLCMMATWIYGKKYSDRNTSVNLTI